MSATHLPDTQNKEDTRQIRIDKVGIKDIKHPLTYINQANEQQPSIGNWTMTVSLPESVKGTHMSRFIEILNTDLCALSTHNFHQLAQKVKDKLESSNAYIQVDFLFFRQKKAPSSGALSMMDYAVSLSTSIEDEKFETTVKVVVPVTSLCPCSKSISDYGAHNQRSHITIEAKIAQGAHLCIEELIDLAEQKASCELYAILKRDDEKSVTERAYNNPAFVEDLVRDIAVSLNMNGKINYYRLESENFESIHNHSAYAVIENQKC
jgi:GTP cyclohydrolase I